MFDYETRALSGDGVFPAYLPYPRFLIRENINDTAKLVYILLLERARLSMSDTKWQEEDGRVFVYYTIEQLAETIGKGMTVVKRAIRDLETANLLRRKQQGHGKPLKIYLRIPADSAARQGKALPRPKKSSSRFSIYGYGSQSEYRPASQSEYDPVASRNTAL